MLYDAKNWKTLDHSHSTNWPACSHVQRPVPYRLSRNVPCKRQLYNRRATFLPSYAVEQRLIVLRPYAIFRFSFSWRNDDHKKKSKSTHYFVTIRWSPPNSLTTSTTWLPQNRSRTPTTDSRGSGATPYTYILLSLYNIYCWSPEKERGKRGNRINEIRKKTPKSTKNA